jgi:DNA-binding transcriptional LysR family regulator
MPHRLSRSYLPSECMHDRAKVHHLRYLLAILQRGGFRAAAEHLHALQTNLTMWVCHFQGYVSICLYRKSKNGRSQQTDVGLAFMALAWFVLERCDETSDPLVAVDHAEIARSSLEFDCKLPSLPVNSS